MAAIVKKYLKPGLLLPALPEGWLVQDLPHSPLDFGSQFVLPLHKPRLLSFLFPHPRDCRVKFYARDHKYEIDGVPTLGSVTGLVHSFCESFDSSAVIPRMQASANWPRQGYLKQSLSDDLIDQLRQIPASEELLSSLFWLGEDEQQIAVAAQQLKYMRPEFAHVIDLLALDAAQIKIMWEENGQKSANQGTWMHYTFELFLNCDRVNLNTPEMNLFLVFLRDLAEHRAFRTEWEIFGEPEQLAGSVDLVLQASDGSLVIVDWKRTAHLSGKYQNAYQNLKEPLSHLPDCAGIHYRLQLNCYRYLIQKYYNLSVTRMVVVSCYPNDSGRPFVDDVPVMEWETERLMSFQRMRVACRAT